MTKRPAKPRPSKRRSIRELILAAGGAPLPGQRLGGGPRSSPDDDVFPSSRNLREQYWNLAIRQAEHPDSPVTAHPGAPSFTPQAPHEIRWRIVEQYIRLKTLIELRGLESQVDWGKLSKLQELADLIFGDDINLPHCVMFPEDCFEAAAVLFMRIETFHGLEFAKRVFAAIAGIKNEDSKTASKAIYDMRLRYYVEQEKRAGRSKEGIAEYLTGQGRQYAKEWLGLNLTEAASLRRRIDRIFEAER
jgi:hypothetical protein